MVKPNRSLYIGGDPTGNGIIEHDCLHPFCLHSWDMRDNALDLECPKCGQTNIARRPGVPMISFAKHGYEERNAARKPELRGYNWMHPQHFPGFMGDAVYVEAWRSGW